VPKPGNPDDAERFRLRNLAHALELWNENTGSLSHLDIDPLPHQIHLVHRILASGSLNWLIADDVGLGKTIEVGMLLAALKQRGGFRRVLVVCPAGLTRQWRDELYHKFRMSDFRIYDEDFQVNEPRHWKLYDHVIGSVDRLKADDHLDRLLQADPWDVIVFDEAHRLSRRQFGMKYDAAQRFQLAARLRERTDAMLLLSATPHQGLQDKFQALLELLRPERKQEIQLLDLDPEILRDMVIRNRKADVTDAEGNFIFKGKTTGTIPVEVGEAAAEFDRALQDYLRRGYAAGRRQGRLGMAIGFVMTVYRKLAASSASAIHRALVRRLARLRLEAEAGVDIEPDEADERFIGEWEEEIRTAREEFFDGEIDVLQALIGKAEVLLRDDRKLSAFVDGMVEQVLDADRDEKILVFTEYRATQQFIADALTRRFGEGCVDLIHGSQKLEERAEAIRHFEEEGQFLVSTEAGGEGINLHRRCHVMANYDLPWNSMRLVQRIGRLYRSGQERRVIVFNVHAPQTLDADIMALMYRRIEQVVRDMAVLGEEFGEGLAEDILGELADLLEVGQILEEATDVGITRTDERIQEALRKAKEALGKQHELFDHVTSFDPDELRGDLPIDLDHLRAFAEGMFGVLGIEKVAALHGGLVWDIRLPEELARQFPGRRTRLRVTLDRRQAAARPDTQMLDLDSPLMALMMSRARAYERGGQAAVLDGLGGGALFTAVLRWQTGQGRRMRQEFTALQVAEDGTVITNPAEFADWLRKPQSSAQAPPAREGLNALLEHARASAERRLGVISNGDLHPENLQWIGGGWCVGAKGSGTAVGVESAPVATAEDAS